LLSLQCPLEDYNYALGQLPSLQHPILLVPHCWSTVQLTPFQTLEFLFMGNQGKWGDWEHLCFFHYAVGTQLRVTLGYQDHRGNTVQSIDTAVNVVDVGSNTSKF